MRLTFNEHRTTIIDRLYYAWCAVFIVRLWSAWLEKTNINDIHKRIADLFPTNPVPTISKPGLFITMPCFLSMELNAHSLTYLAVLVAEKKLTEEALHTSLFNSQMCESTFCVARSMSDPFSSVVNFSVHEFLQRVEKLAVLQSIKCLPDSSMNNIIFPKHHKQPRQTWLAPSTSITATVNTEKLLEETVFSAYLKASQIVCLWIFYPWSQW